MDKKKLVKQELYKAITYFIGRQELVAQAMLDLDLDLDLVARFGAIAWVSGTWDLEDGGTRVWLDRLDKLFVRDESTPEEEALIAALKRNADRGYSQRGSWGENGEWEYYLHGKGCQLTHKKTWEQIDWNCPNRKTFDPFFFEAHLRWQLASSVHKGDLRHMAMWVEANGNGSVQELIEEMVEAGMFDAPLP